MTRAPTAANFTITRSGDTSGTTSLKYKTDATYATATTGSDYIGIGTLQTLTFAPGEDSKTVSVQVVGDTRPEANETFKLALSSLTGATMADASGTATIVNDD